jgi:DNA-binding transcriptional LysR family regulator
MRIAARAERDDLALRLVAQGVGIAIAPRSLATGDVVAVPVTDLRLERSIGLMWRSEMPERLVAAMLDAVSALERATDKGSS